MICSISHIALCANHGQRSLRSMTATTCIALRRPMPAMSLGRNRETFFWLKTGIRGQDSLNGIFFDLFGGFAYFE
jgi:hypothetical protein